MKRLFLFYFILINFVAFSQQDTLKMATTKTGQTLALIDYFYVDTANLERISEKGIEAMLKELDPHSIFITKDEVKKMNEPLEGNFDGIGVSFQFMNDSIHVVEVISDGPAEKVGMLAGDIIIKVDDDVATGDTIKNDWVFKHLRGEKGTKVKVSVKRAGRKEPIVFTITRDKIPLHSIDTWFMVDEQIGYVRLSRFAQTSTEELLEAIKSLQKEGMKDLIFDLRGNGGGYLNVAWEIADHFLAGNKMIVYTEGIHSKKQAYNTIKRGSFEEGRLIILVDEYSASASEIVSGAVQDWDRGVIIGRRTFGKGLVQRPFTLEDKSQIRLTTSRYYTPSGRCIQKPYDEGVEAYQNDYAQRYKQGEMTNADSIHFADSLKYKTNNGRTVYGGGGIMPDVFIPMDTSRASDYLINLRSKSLFNNYSLNWVEKNREDFLKKAPEFKDFSKEYDKLNLLKDFEAYAEKEGVTKTEVKKEWVNQIVMDYLKSEMSDSNAVSYQSYEEYAKSLTSKEKLVKEIIEKAKIEDKKAESLNKESEIYIATTLKALIARNLYGTKYFYMCTSETDKELKKAIEVLKGGDYEKIISNAD
jgi:carboxyl-terminal processing protease